MARFETATLRRAAIHIAERADSPTRFAAEELRRYLQQMTSVQLSVVPQPSLNDSAALVLGDGPGTTSPPSFRHNGSFRITPEPTRISLAAGSSRALLAATYSLLEQFGCRWSLHGPGEETVPRLTGAVEINAVEQNPPFAVRGYCSDIMTWHYTQPEHFDDRLVDDRAFIDWMGKSGANAFFFIRHPFDSQLTIPELLPDFARRGIDVEYGGHVMPLLLPRTLYRQHPEYFPQSPDGARTDHGNLCSSNAAALGVAATHAAQYVRDYPEMRMLHIWGADLWHGGWCHCPDCAPFSVQDQSLRVCNAVAGGLENDGAARQVCYLAYHDTIEPQMTLRPESNVICEFAPRERCYGHALNDPECATNQRYAAALERYTELFEGRVRLFEYYGDAILFFGCAVPLTQVIAADLAYYRRLGIRDISMLQFGTFSLWAYPLNFLTFAAQTATATTANAPIDGYCARFGMHAPAAIAAFAELEAIMQRIVIYGDIRRPPRSSPEAAKILACVQAALPRLDDLSRRIGGLHDENLAAQADLVRYTRMVLDAVCEDLHDTLAGRPLDSTERYAAALQIVSAVERRFKGLWGSVDLPIIHSYYTAAAFTEQP